MRDDAAPYVRGEPLWLGHRAFMLATRWARAQPNFLMIGAPQSASTSLFSYVCQHPVVVPPTIKEVWYFNRTDRYRRGRSWYRSFFPFTARCRAVERRHGVQAAVGEASTMYMCSFQAPARVHDFDPAMKLIAVLRDPIDRAYSEFRKRPRWNQGVSFEQAIELEPERLRGELERLARDPEHRSPAFDRYAYLHRGLYADQLERWLGHFPLEQLLVLTTEELEREPAATVASCWRFLGLPEHAVELHYPRLNAQARYEPMSGAARERLAGYFADSNRRLYELIGRDLGWTRPRAAIPASAR